MVIIAFCLITDQLSKIYVRRTMEAGDSFSVIGDWLRLTFVENRAAVMGLKILPISTLTIVSVLAVLGIGWWLLKLIREPDQAGARWLSAILPWVLGGALGNLIDRVTLGAVTDMIDVDIPDVSLPAFNLGPVSWDGLFLDRWWVFNVADSYIFVGMLMIIALSLSGKLDDIKLPTNSKQVDNNEPA